MKTSQKKPSPRELLKAAKRENKREAYRDLKQYREAILELRRKNLTWKEVQEWLASHGLVYSKNQVFNIAKNGGGKP